MSDAAPPPPPPTDSATPHIANPGWRALAFAIDGVGTVVITTILVFLGLSTGSFATFWAIPLVPLLSAVLSTILTATLGVTPGKALVGTRVVHLETGGPIGAWAIVRSLVIVAPIVLTFIVGVGISALSSLADTHYVADWAYALAFFAPFAGWLALLIVLIIRPQHRGLEDLASRSIVVRR